MRARRATSPDDLVDVHLDDDVTVPGAAAHDAASERLDGPVEEPPAARARRRRLRRTGAVAAAVLVLVAAVANVVELREDRARAARLAGLPGVVASFPDPLEESWRVAGSLVADVGGVLVVDGASGLRGVDAATGEVLWHLTGAERAARGIGHCTAERGGIFGEVVARSDEPRLLCSPEGAFVTGVDDGVEAAVLDPATGATTAVLQTGGRFLGAQWHEGDVLLLAVTPEGQVRASRWDPRTGERRWQTTTSTVAFTAELENHGWGLAGDVLNVTGDVAEVALDVSTGAEVLADPSGSGMSDGGVERLELPDGGTTVTTWSSTAVRTRVLGPDGAVRFEVDGVVVLPQVDDGSGGGVLLVADRDGGVRGVDARTGEGRWSVRLEGVAGAPLVLDGIVLLTGFTATVALDAATGEERWRTSMGETGGIGLVTDGERVLVLEARDGATHLVARTVRDGALAWERPLPERARVLSRSGGQVLVQGQDSVVGLG